MPVTISELAAGKVVEVKITGKLHKEDYEHFVPLFDKLIADHGKLRVLVEMHGFHGWDVSALWQDIKFDLKHFRDIERLALVGESKWEKGMAAFCKPFTSATIRYFDSVEVAAAKTWIEEGLVPSKTG